MNMDVSEYNYLLRAMYINEARNVLHSLEVTSYPNLKKESQEKVFKKYNKAAYPANFEIKNVVKLSDLARVLK